MANNPDSDFYSLALSSIAHQISLASQNDPESVYQRPIDSLDPREYAKSLVERDVPKIDSAIKSYLSLVAARSAVASEIDVISVQCHGVTSSVDSRQAKQHVQCIFISSATSMDANRSSLVCARTLLAGINSTVIPDSNNVFDDSSQRNHHESDEFHSRHQRDVIRIIWNGLVKNPSCPSEAKKKLKPSALLGKNALIVTYPFVKERFRRGVAIAKHAGKTEDEKTDDIGSQKSYNAAPCEVMQQDPLHSIPDILLPPILPPNDIPVTQWESYFTEFGSLLIHACRGQHYDHVQSGSTLEDDSALIWSNDGGVKELQCRRERRLKRAERALAEDGQHGGDTASG